MKDSTKLISFLETLKIPEGPKAGKLLKLAPFQKQFIRGAFDKGVNIACLSIGRGNAKTALSAGVALAELVGVLNDQPRREIIIAARTRDQAAICYQFVIGFVRSLEDDNEKSKFTIRKSPRLEIEYDDGESWHIIRCIAADGKTALGTAPTLVIMDERGHWMLEQGDALEAALISGLHKRGGRALIISTSAPDDTHPFSRWLDEPQEGVYVQEHRPAAGIPADDPTSLEEANPGAKYGIGANLKTLEKEVKRAIARGGSALTSFRLYNRNERVSDENRDVVLTVDEWLACEASEPPARQGQVVIGIDLGGSASMSAAAFYWPETGRLECVGTFPSNPGLLDRGQRDGVGDRYVEMNRRGELATLGDQTVPIAAWLGHTITLVEGETVAAIIADRFKQAELGEAIQAVGIRSPVIWRGTGWRDGNEDVERFQRAAYDGQVISTPSLLLRSAFADAVVLRDPANNAKLAKGRSRGRIDPVQASVIAVAEGARIMARPLHQGGRMAWG
ncbi:terminase large subunit domain-containing protein [Ponticaulis koreensis]|uniref:terminase large subunit domain-containing protein n=1 Tax=Ponticaulis koreensis TaxID=1123045 RepID=UPI0003B430E3|nr:terminase large subunit [Ponticaulis koreensis]